MRLWYFSSTVNAFFKRAWAAIQWAICLIFGRTLHLLPYFMCANREGCGKTESSLVAYMISTIISLAGSFLVWQCCVCSINSASESCNRAFIVSYNVLFASLNKFPCRFRGWEAGGGGGWRGRGITPGNRTILKKWGLVPTHVTQLDVSSNFGLISSRFSS